MPDFNGRVCIVAGGASGIGAKVAECLAHDGATVLIGDVNEDLGRRTAQSIGPNAAFQLLNVADPNSCRKMVNTAVETFGSVDHLVNCAIRMAPGALKDLSLEAWRRVVDIGLSGTFLMCQAAGSWMIDNGRPGSMVNLSSNAGVHPYSQSGAYSTVKAGIIMLSRHFAIEWAPYGIRVNVVCPGHTETPLTAYLADPDIKKARGDVTPLGRVAQPKEIAESVLFLLSDAADYITAARLDVDGGLSQSIFNHMPGQKWD